MQLIIRTRYKFADLDLIVGKSREGRIDSLNFRISKLNFHLVMQMISKLCCQSLTTLRKLLFEFRMRRERIQINFNHFCSYLLIYILNQL